MFQNDAVFPWKTRARQRRRRPAFPRRGRRARRTTAARDWLRRVGLAGFEDRYPHQLSGGMRKRVALAQSLINEPQVLLMDEPFSALDVQTRSIMSDELLALWDLTRPAVIFVTHDLEEAIALADKVVVLTAGPGTRQGELPGRSAAAARRAGDPVRTDEFLALYHEIWEALRAEVETAYARTTAAGAGMTTSDRPVGEHLAPPSGHAVATLACGRSQRRSAASLLNLARLALVVVALGSWELLRPQPATSTPSSGASPSGVWDTLRTWVTDGTPQGSLGRADPRHPAGGRLRLRHRRGARRRVCGIALGRNRLPRRPAVAVHQGRELHPAHRAGVALRPRFRFRR